MSPVDSDDLPQLSARLRDLTTAVAGILALAVAIHPVVMLLQGAREGAPLAEQAHALGQILIGIAPALLYLSALWAVRRIFNDLARAGRPFRPALARGLRRVGRRLAWGAGMDVIGSPMLIRWSDGEGGGAVAYYIPAAVALGVVGLALVLVSRLLQRATDMQNELDGFV